MRVLFVVAEDLHRSLPTPPRYEDGAWAWVVTGDVERAAELLDVVSFDVVVLDVRKRSPGLELLPRWAADLDRPALVFVDEGDPVRVWSAAQERGADAVVSARDASAASLYHALHMAAAHRRAARAAREHHAEVVAVRAHQQRLLADAHEDELTGCLNRRGIQRGLVEGEARGVRRWQALLLDLQGFRSLNERLGYAVGDATLRRLGGALRRITGRRDLVGRLGGDEFLMLLPDATADQAREAAERALATVRRDEISVVDRPLHATATIASCPAEVSLDGLLERLHPVLRRGRAAGARHRVVTPAEGGGGAAVGCARLRTRVIVDHRSAETVGVVFDASPGEDADAWDPLSAPQWEASVATLSSGATAVVGLPRGASSRDASRVVARTVRLRDDVRWIARIDAADLVADGWVGGLRAGGIGIALHEADHGTATMDAIERCAPEFLCIAGRFTAPLADDPMCAMVLRVLRALADGAGATLVADDVPDRRVESALALMGVPLSVRAASPRVVAGGEAYHESGAAEGA